MTSGPTTQLGTIVNSAITITNTPTAFTVAGFVDIQVPAGAVSGTLLQFTVDRPLNAAYFPPVSTLSTTTTLTGFSAPPAGSTFGPTSGTTNTEFNLYPGVLFSKSNIPLLLTNGAAVWLSLSNTSPLFVYTTGGTQYVRQTFDLDGVILTGPGGIWTVDFPITSEVVPEPMSFLALGMGVLALVRRKKR